MTYSFRNRFRLQEGDRIAIDAHEYPLAGSVADGNVVLMAAGRDTIISKTTDLALQGSGYVDQATAAAAGRKWRQVLTVTLARENKSVDFGPDDRLNPITDVVIEKPPYEWLRQAGFELGDRVIGDEIELLVFKSEPTPKFAIFEMGRPIVTVSGVFEKDLSDAREREARPWNRQKTLAYRLVHLALADSNPETRHIQLVTAIEVLLADQDRPQPVLAALESFLAEVDKWPDSEDAEKELKKRMIDILDDDKDESINRAGSEQVAAMLAGKYFDKSAGAFFKHVYDLRSRLVHRESKRRKKKRPDLDTLRNIHPELLRFVLDLLDAYDSD